MAFQFLLNIFLAFVYMFIKVSSSSTTFCVGYIFGMLILILFRRFFQTRFYLARILAVVKLFILFLKELLLSNLAVIKLVLSPRLAIRPGIFALPIELSRDWEVTLLANLITLTPGTFVIDVSIDNKILYVHAIDIEDAEKSISSIKQTFEKAIIEVSK